MAIWSSFRKSLFQSPNSLEDGNMATCWLDVCLCLSSLSSPFFRLSRSPCLLPNWIHFDHCSDLKEVRKRLRYSSLFLLFWISSALSPLFFQARVAQLIPQGYAFVAAQYGIWSAGGISLPLLASNPLPELLYPCLDSGVTMLVVHSSVDDRSKGEESKVQGLIKKLG